MRRALCVNQQVGNQGLDARCRGLARAHARGRRALARARRRRPEPVDAAQDRRRGPQRTTSTASWPSTPPAGIEAVKGARRLGHAGVEDRHLRPRPRRAAAPCAPGRCCFAVDQQAYLQGYLPIVLLTERARYGLFPAQGDVIPTGPELRDRAPTPGKAIELSKRSIR